MERTIESVGDPSGVNLKVSTNEQTELRDGERRLLVTIDAYDPYCYLDKNGVQELLEACEEFLG